MQFLKDETGAVTVEWVVMTAATVGMGMAVMSVVSQGVEEASGNIEDALKSIPILTSFEAWDAYRAHGLNMTGTDTPQADPDALPNGWINGCLVQDGEVVACS